MLNPEAESAPRSVCFVVSSPETVKAFLTDQINTLSERYQVCLVVNLAKGDSLPDLNARVEVITAKIVRNISVFCDLHAVIFLVALFTRRKFYAVHSVTPKAGFLAVLAGVIARVPVRIHTFTGQVWATRSGLSRLMLKTADKALARMATHILIDSHSQRDFLLREGVVSDKKSRVLASGSICGVDPSKFRPDRELRQRIRQREGIPEDCVVFLNLGRLKLDKGVLDLALAFARIGADHPKAWLLVVGPDEEGLRPRMEQICSRVGSRLRFVGHTDMPQEYMAGADAIEANVTGLLHAAGEVADLHSKMKQMMDDPVLRMKMGANAQLRAHRMFSKELIMLALLDFYGTVVGCVC
jgi:glycosyltransferase involved in cell wall biosynthesis